MKFVADMHNNINRHCNVSGNYNETNRCWQVKRAMKSSNEFGSVTHYLLKNIGTGKYKTASLKDMYNLY
jgi:hypothetical protein